METKKMNKRSKKRARTLQDFFNKKIIFRSAVVSVFSRQSDIKNTPRISLGMFDADVMPSGNKTCSFSVFFIRARLLSFVVVVAGIIVKERKM